MSEGLEGVLKELFGLQLSPFDLGWPVLHPDFSHALCRIGCKSSALREMRKSEQANKTKHAPRCSNCQCD